MKFLIGLALLTTSAFATDMMLPIKGVYDGDTVYSELRMLPSPLSKVSIRIANIDTPEVRTTCISEKVLGLAAKKHLESLLEGYQIVLVKDVEWDKYGGRIDGDIILKDGSRVSEKMIESGHARPYYGGSKEPWCY